MENKIERIKELVNICNYHCDLYYKKDKPEISDKAYDNLYNELLELEEETGYILSISPTQKVQGEVLEGLAKVKHTKPMLSADKSKDINDIIKFMKSKECILSWKLDGLTIVLKYNNGKFQQAITRGGGEYGEDVTHSVKCFTNIPLNIEYKGYLELRGEGLVPFKEFERINQELIDLDEEIYSSPRNLASGSVRQLDSAITKHRKLIFIAFGIVQCDNFIEYKDMQFKFLNDMGFTVVEHTKVVVDNIKDIVEQYKEAITDLEYLTDGLIIEFNDIMYGESLGAGGHHTNNMMALKHSDDNYPSKFRGIDESATRTGMISLTSVFDEVDINGSKVTRASVHNIDIFESFEFGVGDDVLIYLANSVIPQIDDNLTRSGTYKLSGKCPACGSPTEIRKLKTARFLFCTNDNCIAKNIQGLIHAVSKSALDISGLSEATIEKFVEMGLIKEISDIFKLEQHKKVIVTTEGFGLKSYNKLIESINKARNTDMYRVLVALGIPQVGVGGAKQISKYFNNDMEKFIKVNIKGFNFAQIEDVGIITNDAIHKWFKDENNQNIFVRLMEQITIKQEMQTKTQGKDLSGLTFVITGSVINFKNRDEIKTLIESLNGKVSGSVSAKTNYLINNDIESTSGKNKDAKSLNIPIINEEQFLEMIK